VAIADAVVKRGTVTQALVDRHQEIFAREGWLSKYNIERDQQIELLGNALISGVDPLLIGDPGVGKTWLIELMLRCIEIDPAHQDTALFNYMVFKESSADDVLGPRSLPAMKEGRIERLTDGFLPTSILAYLDEIFKCSPTMANALLDVMAQRKLKVGGVTLDLRQLLCIFGSSNELPDREDLQPFRDRWGVTNVVQSVRTPEGRKAVMRIQDEYQAAASNVDMTDAPKLTLDEIEQARREAMAIIVPDVVIESMDTAIERWSGAGHEPSSRRVGQMLKAMKARAWSRGDSHVTTDDMIVCQHMAWNHPDHRKSAHDIVMEFANVFARKASRMKEALDPVLAELSDLRNAVQAEGGEPNEEQLTRAWKVMRELRGLKKEANAQINTGHTQGHDTTDLEAVLSEVTQAHKWVEETLTGDDED